MKKGSDFCRKLRGKRLAVTFVGTSLLSGLLPAITTAPIQPTHLSGIPFLAAINCVRGEEPAAWPYQRSVGRFVVHSNYSLEESTPLIDEIGALQKDVAQLLQLEPRQEVLHVVLFDQPRSYQEYLAHYFPKVPARRAIFIKHRGPGMVFAHQHGDLATDIRHESTHALLHDSLDAVPLWLDEGLAEYFEVPAADRQSVHPHLQEIRWHTRLRLIPDLESLEKLDENGDMSKEQYRDAWAWVHFLMHRDPSTRQLLVDYLKELRTGNQPEDLHRQVQREIPDWRDEFISHFRSFPIPAKSN